MIKEEGFQILLLKQKMHLKIGEKSQFTLQKLIS